MIENIRFKRKLIKSGDAILICTPREFNDALGWKAGDYVYFCCTDEGKMLIEKINNQEENTEKPNIQHDEEMSE